MRFKTTGLNETLRESYRQKKKGLWDKPGGITTLTVKSQKRSQQRWTKGNGG